MTRHLLTGNAAAAWGARLADVEYVPGFPITPQTEILETLASWIAAGEIRTKLVMFESEHSMLTAAGAAAATGVRTLTATSSQGLLYAMEMLYTVAGWRAPFVLINVSRGVSAPITLEPDHQDVLAARDTGFLQLHAATCQEVLDAVLLAHRISEHPEVRLPALVNLDGFQLSFTREPVEVPSAEAVRRFLPPFEPGGARFCASRPSSQGVSVLGGSLYSYFRYQMHLANERALSVFVEASRRLSAELGREYHAVESYRADDADIVFVMIGSLSTKARAMVDELRTEGWSIGLVRPFLLRPFPESDLRQLLGRRRAVIVVDQNLSLGTGGILHGEIARALYGTSTPPLLLGFVGGLGGREIRPGELRRMAEAARSALEAGSVPPPRLLFTADELGVVRHLQSIAGGAIPEGNGA